MKMFRNVIIFTLLGNNEMLVSHFKHMLPQNIITTLDGLYCMFLAWTQTSYTSTHPFIRLCSSIEHSQLIILLQPSLLIHQPQWVFFFTAFSMRPADAPIREQRGICFSKRTLVSACLLGFFTASSVLTMSHEERQKSVWAF